MLIGMLYFIIHLIKPTEEVKSAEWEKKRSDFELLFSNSFTSVVNDPLLIHFHKIINIYRLNDNEYHGFEN